jgi:glyoxylase-like metal-dependent hydrolase (beta-lactamase superfamily II)
MTTSTPDRRGWEKPGAHEVAPDIHRIPLPLPQDALRAVNVYAVAGADGLTLVDAGWALEESRTALEAALATLDRDLGDIRRFLITHAHRDHYTQAITIRRVLGTKVALGADEQPNLDSIQARAGHDDPSPQLVRLATHGAADLARRIMQARGTLDAAAVDQWESPDGWLQEHTVVEAGTRSLQVIPTPGHTRGHVVFHDAQAGLLFAGDHVLPHITPSIGFEAAPTDSPLAAYLSSLEVMLGLPDATLLPAHGPVQPSVHHRVRELLAHHTERLDHTLTAVQNGRTTGYEVAHALPWTRHHRAFDDLDLFSQMLATNETVAHLTVLADTGALREHHAQGRVWFTT